MDALAAGCHPGPVTPSEDDSPHRRPVFFPVVIATVFLTIIGLTAGFVLGERRRDEDKAAASQPTEESQPVVAPSSAAASSGPPCPAETQQTATEGGFPGDLRQTLKIETDNGTVVWICRDPAGRLYYQGKTGGPGTALVQHKNGLFLPGVIERGPDDYLAVADNGNRIFISRERLEVRFTNGKTEQHQVVSVE
jgi:hypothetical protein